MYLREELAPTRILAPVMGVGAPGTVLDDQTIFFTAEPSVWTWLQHLVFFSWVVDRRSTWWPFYRHAQDFSDDSSSHFKPDFRRASKQGHFQRSSFSRITPQVEVGIHDGQLVGAQPRPRLRQYVCHRLGNGSCSDEVRQSQRKEYLWTQHRPQSRAISRPTVVRRCLTIYVGRLCVTCLQ